MTCGGRLSDGVRVHKALAFHLEWQDTRLEWLLKEFRLIVNKSIRVAIRGDLRSRVRLARASYADLSRDHAVYKQYIPSAFEVALGCLKARRCDESPLRPPGEARRRTGGAERSRVGCVRNHLTEPMETTFKRTGPFGRS